MTPTRDNSPVMSPHSPWTAGRPKLVCDLIRQAALQVGIPPQEVVRRSNEMRPVAARRKVARQLRCRRYSLNQIGRWLHHATILHYLEGMPDPAAVLEGIADHVDLSGEWAI